MADYSSGWCCKRSPGWRSPRLKAAGICTNDRFAGVLFTGQMTGAALEGAVRSLGKATCCWLTLLPPVNTTNWCSDGFIVQPNSSIHRGDKTNGVPSALVHRANEVVGTAFDIDINPADVFPQHADTDQLNSPKKQNSHDQ